MTKLTFDEISLFAGDVYRRGDGRPNDNPPMGATVIDSWSFLGLSAAAYAVNGEIILSFGGTDQLLLDPITGWPVGAGWAEFSVQAAGAMAIYNQVVNLCRDNITLTGHSLGGGLAGLIGSIVHKEAFVFDHMPFVASANNIYGISSDPQNPPMGLRKPAASRLLPVRATYRGVVPMSSQSQVVQMDRI